MCNYVPGTLTSVFVSASGFLLFPLLKCFSLCHVHDRQLYSTKASAQGSVPQSSLSGAPNTASTLTLPSPVVVITISSDSVLSRFPVVTCLSYQTLHSMKARQCLSGSPLWCWEKSREQEKFSQMSVAWKWSEQKGKGRKKNKKSIENSPFSPLSSLHIFVHYMYYMSTKVADHLQLNIIFSTSKFSQPLTF